MVAFVGFFFWLGGWGFFVEGFFVGGGSFVCFWWVFLVDFVWVVKDEENQWVCMGFFWGRWEELTEYGSIR